MSQLAVSGCRLHGACPSGFLVPGTRGVAGRLPLEQADGERERGWAQLYAVFVVAGFFTQPLTAQRTQLMR